MSPAGYVILGALAANVGVVVGGLAVRRARSPWRRYRCHDCNRVFRSRLRYRLHKLQPGVT